MGPGAQAPFQPAFDQLGDALGLAAAVLARGDLGEQLGLDLTDPALAAGEGSRPA
jgi:hypothetical protein